MRAFGGDFSVFQKKRIASVFLPWFNLYADGPMVNRLRRDPLKVEWLVRPQLGSPSSKQKPPDLGAFLFLMLFDLGKFQAAEHFVLAKDFQNLVEVGRRGRPGHGDAKQFGNIG